MPVLSSLSGHEVNDIARAAGLARCSPKAEVRGANPCGRGISQMPFSRCQFPPLDNQHGVWVYVHFTLSYRDVEDLLAERDVSYETTSSDKPGSSGRYITCRSWAAIYAAKARPCDDAAERLLLVELRGDEMPLVIEMFVDLSGPPHQSGDRPQHFRTLCYHYIRKLCAAASRPSLLPESAS